MKRFFPISLTLAFLITSNIKAQQAPLPATEILQAAMKKAGAENKNVLIIFHASWCGWCHKMDSSINDVTCKKFFDDNYVITHLVVDESRDKKNLENPGSRELRAKYHGDGEGIPFWLVFDKDGNLLADSQLRPAGASPDTKGQNVGCPAAEQEVAYFMEVLKKTSKVTPAELSLIEQRFRKNEN